MVNKEILAEHGVSVEAWKKILVLPESKKGKAPRVVYSDPALNALAERVRSRCVNGRSQNTQDFRTIRALDLIWNSPFRQVSPTLLSDIAANCKSTSETLSVLKLYGLDPDRVFVEKIDSKSGIKAKHLNVPMFFAVTIPLVSGMLSARKARLINDRNLEYLFDYQPAINTKKNRARCSAIKSRMRVMAQQYNYLATLDQVVHQMLLYGQALLFTQENWHWEEQLRSKNGESSGEGKKKKKNTESYVVKEGLRYFIPHPARTFWDRSHPVKTFNTETGCDWAGHWKILQYKELAKNPEFWNSDKITAGDPAWWKDNTGFLNVFFNTSAISAPTLPSISSVPDREDMIANPSVYGVADEDRSVCVFEYRERLVPSQNGLGDYDYPVWARFVVAGDGTIIYAEPLTHRAVLVWKDNGDENLTKDASMALKLAPFQDQLSNIISQYLLSVKQNLAQITLIDQNVLGKDGTDKLSNLGEGFFRDLNIHVFDAKQLHARRDNLGSAIYSHRFPQLDTNAMLSAAKMVIELAERVLNFSPSEAGQAASHEQSSEEVKQQGSVTTNSLKYIGIPVDAGLTAWGQQLYEAWMNEGEDDFFAEIPLDSKMDSATLKDIGFEFKEEPDATAGSVHVTAKRSKVLDELMSFSLMPNTTDRRADSDVARVLVELVRDLLNNPVTAQAVGADQAVSLYNVIIRYMRIPVDGALVNTGMTPEKQAEQAKEQLKKLVDQVKGQFAGELEGKILNEVKQGLVPVMQLGEGTAKKVDFIWNQVLKLPPVNGQPQDIQDPQSRNSEVPSAMGPPPGGEGLPPALPEQGPGMPI